MLTSLDLMTLDYTMAGVPVVFVSGSSGVDGQSLDYTMAGAPVFTATSSGAPYDPLMYASIASLVTAGGDIIAKVELAASISAQSTMSGFMNLGNTAKLVNVF